jgi:hypothetical protein
MASDQTAPQTWHDLRHRLCDDVSDPARLGEYLNLGLW